MDAAITVAALLLGVPCLLRMCRGGTTIRVRRRWSWTARARLAAAVAVVVLILYRW